MEQEYNFMCCKSPLVVESRLFYVGGEVAPEVSIAEVLKNYTAARKGYV